jgi:hypothetical protein
VNEPGDIPTIAAAVDIAVRSGLADRIQGNEADERRYIEFMIFLFDSAVKCAQDWRGRLVASEQRIIEQRALIVDLQNELAARNHLRRAALDIYHEAMGATGDPGLVDMVDNLARALKSCREGMEQ